MTDVLLAARWALFVCIACMAAACTDAPVQAFRDCPACPEMVVVPAGTFVMGSADDEAGRDADEGPQHTVTVDRAFAVARYEITRGMFAIFVRESGYQPTSDNCHYWNNVKAMWLNEGTGRTWRDPGYTQGENHPVVCVTWPDAKAYVAWLAARTKRDYRLLTEAEWEYAARGGSDKARPWGNDADAACRHANVRDRAFGRLVPPGEGREWPPEFFHNCEDSAGYTAAVGSYRPNRFGLYDMMGNAWEWVEDCYNESYTGAPADRSAWLAGDCTLRVNRGASWQQDPKSVRTAHRAMYTSGIRADDVGFRVARALDP